MFVKADVFWDKKRNEATMYLDKENGEQTKYIIGHVYSWKDTVELLTGYIAPYGTKIKSQENLSEDNFYKEQTFFLG